MKDGAIAVVENKNVHILKPSSSRYGLRFDNETRLQYCCQDGCCDRGLQPDVAFLVRKAKDFGAEKVIIRTGQGSFYWRKIEGLPVEDVSKHLGPLPEGFVIESAY